mgnify:CR=1 FL=1
MRLIRNYKSLSNENEITEFANNKLDLIFPFASPVRPQFYIYRTRPKSNIKDDEDLSSPSAFSYVPIELNLKKIPSIGRFNKEGQSVFYASISASTNLKEMKDCIREGDVVYISKWSFKEDSEIKLYYIYPPEHLKPKLLQDSLLANVIDNQKVDQVTSDFFKELGYMLLEDNTNNNVYLKTALIADKIYKFDNHGISYDAILYPSVQGHEYDLNLAIKPQYVDNNLVLQCVYEATVKDNKIEIDCSHLGINENNRIRWYEFFVYEDDISVNSFSFLNEEKLQYKKDIVSIVCCGNKEYIISEFLQFLINEKLPSNEELNNVGFFRERFYLEDDIKNICKERFKYYELKVDNVYFYNSDIRYDVSFIRVWIRYINSLKPYEIKLNDR